MAVPRLQTNMTMKIAVARNTVTYPPWKNLVRLEKKNIASMAPKKIKKTTAAKGFLRIRMR